MQGAGRSVPGQHAQRAGIRARGSLARSRRCAPGLPGRSRSRGGILRTASPCAANQFRLGSRRADHRSCRGDPGAVGDRAPGLPDLRRRPHGHADPHAHHADPAGRASPPTTCRPSRSTWRPSPARWTRSGSTCAAPAPSGRSRRSSSCRVVEGISECELLAQAVRRGPLAVELHFPYHPHVTIAHHLADAQLDRAFAELADFECEFAADALRALRPRRRRRLAAHARVRAAAAPPDVRGVIHALIDDASGASRIRERRPLVDHLVRTVAALRQRQRQRPGRARSPTSRFLSFFPILALAFAVIGFVSRAYPNAERRPDHARSTTCCPASSATAEGRAQPGAPSQKRRRASSASASLVALYSGLGWLSGMRTALIAVFEEPEKEQPNFVVGKLRDVIAPR